jgi:predicted ATPase
MVDGFRNLENIVIPIGDIAAFVSENNYGKSNVLMALRFGFDFLTSDSDGLRNTMMKYQPGIPICAASPRSKFSFGLEGTIQRKSGETCSVKYEYSFDWVGKYKRSIRFERLQIKGLDDAKPRYRDYIVRDDNAGSARFLRALSGRCSTRITVKPGELAARKLLAYDDLFFIEILERLTSVSVRVTEHFDAKPEATIMLAFRRRESPEFDLENIKHLPKYLYQISHKYPDSYSRLVDSIMQLIPDIESIEPQKLTAEKHVKKIAAKTTLTHVGDNGTDDDININIDIEDDMFIFDDSLYQLYIHYRNLNQPVEISRMSDGTCRVLALLTTAVSAKFQNVSLLCFEELENNIHPKLFRSLLNIILQLADGCKVVFTSHSPYMVNYISLDKIYIGIPNDDGKGHFAPLSLRGQKAVAQEAQALEISTGEFVFDALAGDEDALEIITKNAQAGEW